MIKHEYCVTYAKLDAAGEPIEVHHGHCNASTPEEAAVLVALDAAQEGLDVSDCDAMLRVIMTPPPELTRMLKIVMATGARVVVARMDDPLSAENIKKGVAESVGGWKDDSGDWVFPATEAKTEFLRRLATVMDAATPAPKDPGSRLH